MPKRRVDDKNLHGFRIELNETERDALQYWAVSSSFRNIGVGVGSVITPVLNNLAVIMAALVAKEGAGAISKYWNQQVDRKVAKWREECEAEYDDWVASMVEQGKEPPSGPQGIKHRENAIMQCMKGKAPTVPTLSDLLESVAPMSILWGR